MGPIKRLLKDIFAVKSTSVPNSVQKIICSLSYFEHFFSKGCLKIRSICKVPEPHFHRVGLLEPHPMSSGVKYNFTLIFSLVASILLKQNIELRSVIYDLSTMPFKRLGNYIFSNATRIKIVRHLKFSNAIKKLN